MTRFVLGPDGLIHSMPLLPKPTAVIYKRGTITEPFLQSVADNYIWAVENHKRPAPFIAEQTGMSVRTVHAWVRMARATGQIGKASQGSTGIITRLS